MFKFKSYLAFIFIAIFFIQCDNDDDDNGSPKDNQEQTGTINMSLNHEVNNQDLAYDTMLYKNEAGEDFGVTKLEYIITELRLYKGENDFEEISFSHYANPKQAATQNLTIKDVPAGDYNRVTFRFGVDSANNQAGNLPNSPDYNNMGWPMEGGGYHYMRMNGIYDSSGFQDGFTTHLGPAMGNHYSFEVELANSDIQIDGGDNWQLNITMEMANWYKNPNTYAFGDLNSEGIMNNPQAQETLMENGQDVFELNSKVEAK